MIDKRVVAIDPGDRHVGWCEALVDPHTLKPRWLVAGEKTPDEATFWAAQTFDAVDVVVIEKFTLYPDKAKSQIGSDMKTSQLIGVLKYLTKNAGCDLVMQPASIKIPTESVLKRRRVNLVAVKEKKGGHAKDAELHLRHYLLKLEKEGPANG